jgi:hypothetical protein
LRSLDITGKISETIRILPIDSIGTALQRKLGLKWQA